MDSFCQSIPEAIIGCLSDLALQSVCYPFALRTNEQIRLGGIELLLIIPKKFPLSLIRGERMRFLKQIREKKHDSKFHPRVFPSVPGCGS